MNRNKILFLIDVVTPVSRHKRYSNDYIQYFSAPNSGIALGAVPHAPLLGPVLLGTILQNQGYDVKVLECAFRPLQRENLNHALAQSPDFVLISTTFMEETETAKVAIDNVRARSPKSIVILGGPSLGPNHEMRKLADYCILGEGEESLPNLLQKIRMGESAKELPGLCWHDSEGLHNGKPATLLPDLNHLPFPNWDLVVRGKNEFHPVFTQRGCYWRCAFCSYPANEGYKLRYRSPELVVQEIANNYEKYGIWRTLFLDSTFSFPLDRCTQILEGICKLPFKVEWMAFARVDNITPELAELMARSGCKGLFFGCDSGDDTILQKMNKRFTSNDIRRGIGLMKKHGISSTGSWIIGFPGETKETVKNCLDLILEVDCEQNIVHRYSIYEVSPVGLRKEKFGIEGDFGNWKHESMNNTRADKWVRWVLLKMISKGLNLSSTYDIAWLSTVGFNPDQTVRFFADLQKIGRKKFLISAKRGIDVDLNFEKMKKEISEQCNQLFRSAISHPMFASKKPKFQNNPMALESAEKR